MRTGPNARRRRWPVWALCLVLGGALALEGTLVAASARARDALRRAPGAPVAASADELAAAADGAPAPEAYALAARAEAAAGRFDLAARHAALAARLAPLDPSAAEAADAAVTDALLARVSGVARPAGAVALLALVLLASLAGVRRRRARRRASYVARVAPRLVVGGRHDGVVRLDRDDAGLSVDLFLGRPAGLPAPRPGPTLAVVLSHAGSNRSLRLTPRRDVREDAVRVRLREETLAAVLARPGTWRLQARLDDRPVGDARLEVA